MIAGACADCGELDAEQHFCGHWFCEKCMPDHACFSPEPDFKCGGVIDLSG